jgi:aryl sulfotransferase
VKTSKVYKTWAIDSTRWQHYRPRTGDIVIATYPKCGTTWVQQIVSLLIFQSPEARPLLQISPWIDNRFQLPVEAMQHLIEQQRHRRFFKCHLPFDGLPHYDRVRYIHVARDGRDVCMSLFNHCAALTPLAYDLLDSSVAEMGGPFPRCPDDPRVFWKRWLTRAIHPADTNGFPDLSFFDLEMTYWQARHTDRLLLVHYNDLKTDLEGEMRRIAAFLSIAPPRRIWPRLVEAATFDSMRREGETLLGGFGAFFEGGLERFLFKGSNGRWQDLMTPDDLLLYERAVDRITPGLARWLENGRLIAGDPRMAPD